MTEVAIDAIASWTAQLPEPGRYNVYARWEMSEPENRTTNAPFTVRACGGDSTVRVDMSQWQSVAEFPACIVQSPWNLLVQRNAVDPCQPEDGSQTYHITLLKMGSRIQLFVDDESVLFYIDDSGDPHGTGKFGFRQIYRSTISYDNLRIHHATR